jgi:hypothetical protein
MGWDVDVIDIQVMEDILLKRIIERTMLPIFAV